MVEEMEGLKRKQLILTFCGGEVSGSESKGGGEGRGADSHGGWLDPRRRRDRMHMSVEEN